MTGDLRGKLTVRLEKSFHEETDTHPSVFLRFFFLLDDLFAGGVSPSPEASGDANNDAGLDISDAIFLLTFLFDSGASPAAPYPDAGCP